MSRWKPPLEAAPHLLTVISCLTPPRHKPPVRFLSRMSVGRHRGGFHLLTIISCLTPLRPETPVRSLSRMSVGRGRTRPGFRVTPVGRPDRVPPIGRPGFRIRTVESSWLSCLPQVAPYVVLVTDRFEGYRRRQLRMLPLKTVRNSDKGGDLREPRGNRDGSDLHHGQSGEGLDRRPGVWMKSSMIEVADRGRLRSCFFLLMTSNRLDESR